MMGTSSTTIIMRKWQVATSLLLAVSIGFFIGVFFNNMETRSLGARSLGKSKSKGSETCGQGRNPNGNYVDLTEPKNPGPFHDLTREELTKLREFLENDPVINATETAPENSLLDGSYIYTADLWLPPKTEVLRFLDEGGIQPPRKARVIMFRGDKQPPVVEEWICGPLPNITDCELVNFSNRRNPVEFASRQFSTLEAYYVGAYLLPIINRKVGHILKESYNATFLDSDDPFECLTYHAVPYTSALTGKLHERWTWLWGLYNVPYPKLHPVDFGVLIEVSSPDMTKWKLDKVWYAGAVFDSLDDLVAQYNSCTITKSSIPKPVYSSDLFSSLELRGQPSPPIPQRPPTLVEPDGIRYTVDQRKVRYTVDQRKVDYLGWSFNFRVSPFGGSALYDVRFQGDRILYELALSEIAAYYSGVSPLSQTTDYVDSGALTGLRSKTLVPGGDCPDSATLIYNVVMNQHSREPGLYDVAFCLFEHNNNYPLRRHSQYGAPTGFYGGMLDSVLILRSAFTVGNYDYIVDFIFHQNGALETRLMSTGYIQGNIWNELERRYGYQIQDYLHGPLHHHMFHLKADLDIKGVSNRYKTLDTVRDNTTVTWDPSTLYTQTKIVSNLKHTEQESLLSYNMEHPKDHIVYNENNRDAYNNTRGFRIHLTGMSKNIYPEGEGNEPVISWARHQIAVTKRKEEEFRSSSSYGMYDTLDPVVDFSKFYADNENIVDEDLVIWLTMGMHHIPHTEDLPVTPTVGNHMGAFFLPFNYFPECPSMSYRDAIYVSYKDRMDPTKGIKLNRNGNSLKTCMLPESTLEDDLENNPDMVLESRRLNPTI